MTLETSQAGMQFGRTGRLSTLAAAFVVARRDFTAILFSRGFIFFLLGPLFPILIGTLAGGIGQKVSESADRPQLGLAMSKADIDAFLHAYDTLRPRIGAALPDLVVVRELAPGEQIDAAAAVHDGKTNLAALLTGTLAAPHLTGSADRTEAWSGTVSLLAAEARGDGVRAYPPVATTTLASSSADKTHSRMLTAQFGQTILFLLMMVLAGMVLSNLVEEKGNKIIEVLAAAIPMDAVFLGKLFAMLAVSWVGITVWGLVGGSLWFAAGHSLANYPAPAVGWGLFFALGVLYFSTGYLILGSLFLAIGSMAATVRDVQTLSMPVTVLQLINFFFASYAMARPGTWIELTAMVVPFSSPFAMLARAAQYPALLPHGAALAWQVLCVAVFVRAGAALFKRRVMKSGPAKVRSGGLFARRGG